MTRYSDKTRICMESKEHEHTGRTGSDHGSPASMGLNENGATLSEQMDTDLVKSSDTSVAEEKKNNASSEAGQGKKHLLQNIDKNITKEELEDEAQEEDVNTLGDDQEVLEDLHEDAHEDIEEDEELQPKNKEDIVDDSTKARNENMEEGEEEEPLEEDEDMEETNNNEVSNVSVGIKSESEVKLDSGMLSKKDSMLQHEAHQKSVLAKDCVMDDVDSKECEVTGDMKTKESSELVKGKKLLQNSNNEDSSVSVTKDLATGYEEDDTIQICSIESINSISKEKRNVELASVRLSTTTDKIVRRGAIEKTSNELKNAENGSKSGSLNAKSLELNGKSSCSASKSDSNDKMDVEAVSEVKQESDSSEPNSVNIPPVPVASVSEATVSSGEEPSSSDLVIKEEAGSPVAPTSETKRSEDKGKEPLKQKGKDTPDKPSEEMVANNASGSKSDETEDSSAKKNDDTSSTSNSTPVDESTDPETQKKSSSSRTCAECGAAKGLKYQVLFQGKTRFLCSDLCFKVFRGKQKLAPPPSQRSKTSDSCGICNREIKSGQGYFPFSGDSKPVCSEECMVKYQQAHTPKPSCAQCQLPIEGRTKCLTWETMEFCNEDCLGVYQSTMGSHCACCKAAVQRLSLGKYCVRFGADIRQFCTGKCLEEFKKGLKVCTFCQKDMSNTAEGFLGPVGDKFRDFCTSKCMEQYEDLNEASSLRPHAQKCSVCQKMAPAKVQVKHKDREHILCSDPCIAAFRYTQKIYATLCDTCNKFFNNEPSCLQVDSVSKKFCTKTCLNLFVLSHRKIVPCTWCKVKKYNFDMIERVDNSNNSQLFCSLNCLSLFRVSLNATSSRCVNCDHCRLHLPAQYHLTMSDASIRNFCSYPCVIKFQGQFTTVPTLTTVTPSLNRQQGPTPVGKATLAPPSGTPTTKNGNSSSPVIANVMSLAPAGTSPAQVPNVLNSPKPQVLPAPVQVTKSVASVGTNSGITSTTTTTTNGMPVVREVHREIIVAPPVPRMVKNKMIMCKPLVQNKGVACKPHPCHKETQTDEYNGMPTIIPIPIPIFVPMPVHMYSRSVPFPMPFPIPIPVPIFIPTTRNTTAKVIKDIFEIQEKVPSNPFEAELLLMAEMVAAEEEKNPSLKEDEESLDSVLKDAKDKEEVPMPLEDLETLVPLPPAIPEKTVSSTALTNDDRLLHPVVQLTQLSSDYALNDNYSEDSSQPTTPAETKRKTPVVTSTARRGSKRGRGRGRRGRKRPRMVDSDDDSDEEWLPSETGVDIVPGIPSTPVVSVVPKDSPKAPPVIVPPKPAAATTSKAPVIIAKPSTLTPNASPAGFNATTTSPMVVTASKPDPKAAGDSFSPDAHLCLKYMFGVNAWKHWVVQKNVQLEKGSQSRRLKLFKTDLLQMSPDELNYALCLFVKEVRKPNSEEYAPDSIYYLCLGIQLFLFENGRVDNIFTDSYYEKFTECLNDVLLKHDIIGTLRKEAHFVSRIEEEILWESKQLGAHSPQVLLNTLMYFNTKQFHLQSVDDHLQLSFTYIMKGWRKFNNHSAGSSKATRCAVLRYYPPPARGVPDTKKAWREDAFTYEQEENFDNPLRCPVKLYEFYLSKCPESIRTRNDLFYMCPERSCVPDSPVWYSTQPLAKDTMVKMLQRIYLVREISIPGPETAAKDVQEKAD